jgi:hypothetical protein
MFVRIIFQVGSGVGGSSKILVPKTIAAYRSMVNVNNSSANSSSNALGSLEKKSVKPMDRNSIRSQSLLEIGGGQKAGSRSSSHPPNLRSYSSSGLIGGLGTNQDQNNVNIQGERRKNTLTKMKGLVIPETETPSTSQSKTLTTPPWKDESSNLPKYSPAFKRKPFSVLGHGQSERGQMSNNLDQNQQTQNNGGSKNNTQQQIDSTNVQMHQKQNNHQNHVVKSDDSDNDSAVSSGRSSLSHSSVSPPSSPKSNGKSGLRNGSSDPRSAADSSAEADTQNPRVLKKDSIEAINRRNILNSCKKSNAKTKMGDHVKNPNGTPHWNGKPASRSSSFTIAERKKSFETMQTNIRSLGESAKVNTHSSQDSLSRKSSRECESGFTSRRPSSNSELPIQSSSNSSRRGTCSSLVFTNPVFPICNWFFREKVVFLISVTVRLAFCNLF